MQVVANVMNQEPRPVSELVANVPPVLSEGRHAALRRNRTGDIWITHHYAMRIAFQFSSTRARITEGPCVSGMDAII